MTRWAGVAVLSAAAMSAAQAQDPSAPLTVYAAGSLRAALTRIGADYEASSGGRNVTFVFGASGLLRDRLLGGERADVFASANMEHPQALAAAGRAQAVQPFTRNALCALVAPAGAAPARRGCEARHLHAQGRSIG
jgi:molybdate transport system substrate-binding protein